MGGIGKTTLATTLYDKLSDKFEGRCFLADVREKSDKLKALRDELFSKLLGNKNHSFDNSEMSRLLQRKKVFIVLDDVDTSEQLEKLIYEYKFLGLGSRVIVTTRNKQILSPVDEIYPVQDLGSHHSLQLFCLTAFGEKQPKDGNECLSRRVISYCKGIPLAVKVLGASLRSRSKEAWECELGKLQKIPNMEIHKVLKLSYDGLDRSQQDTFLDIACFLKGETRHYVTNVLEAFDDFFPASGIEVLLDKALITISYGNRIEMHDLIQEMHQEIVHQECIKDPGRRSRLWRHGEVLDVLKYKRGTDAIEGIILDLSILTGDLYLSSDSLAKITNVRFLKIHRTWHWSRRFSVYLQNGLESFPYKLRYLEWYGFCLESLPSNFCAEQLVELWMPHSKLKKLWDRVQNFVNLKIIHLKDSQDLIEIPDLSVAKKLESVSLSGCKSLRQLHPSKLSLPKLTDLDLTDCKKIESLNVDFKYLHKLDLLGCSSLKEISITSEEMTILNLYDNKVIESLNIHSKSLNALYLYGCSSLKEVSVASEEMTELNLSDTAIRALSSSMLSLPKLTCLYLSGCRDIESLNVDSKYLCKLDLNGCSSLKEISLPYKLSYLEWDRCCLESLSSTVSVDQLVQLRMRESKLKKLWDGVQNLVNLKIIDLQDSRDLIEIPDLSKAEKLESVSLSGCESLCQLHPLMLSLPKLKRLSLRDCRETESLNIHSKSLSKLDLYGCSSLKEISVASEKMTELNLSGIAIRALSSSMLSLPKLTCLYLSGCREIESLNVDSKYLCKLDLNGCSSLKEISLPYKLSYLEWDGCCLESLSSIFFVDQLVELRMRDSKLKKLWDGVQNLVNLKIIDLQDSRDLIEIPDLSKAEKLESVSLSGCESLCHPHPLMLSLPKLKRLSLRDFSETKSLNIHSKSLSKLDLYGCSSLKEILVASEEMTILDLSGTAIWALSSSMLSLPKLTNLYLRDCKKIESLNVHSKSLSKLDLCGCSSLKEILVTSEDMTVLDLSGTAIRALSSSMLSLPKLKCFYLRSCKEIESRNVHLKSLNEFDLNGCSSLKEFSVTSEEITELNLSHTAISALPSSIFHLLSLEELDLSGTNVESLPANIKNLSMLRWLHLTNCMKLVSLPELPPSVEELYLNGCRELMSLSELPPYLGGLYLNDCWKLMSLPELPPSLEDVIAFNCASLETDNAQKLLLQHMLQNHIHYLNEKYLNYPEYFDSAYFIFPGDPISNECGFHTAESSITIPYLPKSHLYGFIYCIILSRELLLKEYVSCSCSIYQDGIKVGWDSKGIFPSNLISNHVLFWYHDVSKFDRISEVYDHFSNITFIFEFNKEIIKGCGVFPVYATTSGFKLLSSSSKESFEWQSITQISDNIESQSGAIRVGVEDFNNVNEDDREQLPAS